MSQLVARFPADLVKRVDELVAKGGFASRSAAVRAGPAMVVDTHRRSETARRIIERYTLHPQCGDEAGWADEAAVRMIAEEPW
jgi:Arc/MetJ-type ribon-helix-helix transcriptional regulator